MHYKHTSPPPPPPHEVINRRAAATKTPQITKNGQDANIKTGKWHCISHNTTTTPQIT